MGKCDPMHSRKDLTELNSLKSRISEEINSLNLPGQALSREQIDNRRELNAQLRAMDLLETKASDYNFENYDQEKVRKARDAFEHYKSIMKTDTATADLFLAEFLERNITDSKSKKMIKALCFDKSDKDAARTIYDKASEMESREIFNNLQQNFPRGWGRGDCGTCADKVETCLREMNLQFHSYNRIQGLLPVTPHIATELIRNNFDNSQKANSRDSIVLDMWLNGTNFTSGFEGLDYDVFNSSSRKQHEKMGVYKRDEWPITNATLFEGTVR